MSWYLWGTALKFVRFDDVVVEAAGRGFKCSSGDQRVTGMANSVEKGGGGGGGGQCPAHSSRPRAISVLSLQLLISLKTSF